MQPSPTADPDSQFELGINYWPRRRAMYMWREFDIGEIRDDLAQISDIGFDTVQPLRADAGFPAESRNRGVRDG